VNLSEEQLERLIAAMETSTREAAKVEVKSVLVEFLPVLARAVKDIYREESIRRKKCPCCGRRYGRGETP
jgi:hypothetical protein